MDPVLFSLLPHRVTNIDWSLQAGSDGFDSDNFVTGTLHGYLAERSALMKCQKVDDGTMLPVRGPATDLNWIPGVGSKTITRAERDYRPDRGVPEDDAVQPADVPDDNVMALIMYCMTAFLCA